jgi:hypothetical protein
MSEHTRALLKVLLLVDVALFVLLFLFGSKEILWSSQIGYWSSTLILFASMSSYRRMVERRADEGLVTYDDSKDVIDTLEDPYDLYSEPKEEASEENMAEAIKEEKRRLKAQKRTFKETLRDTKTALALKRLGAYGVLIVGFFYLNDNHLFEIVSYILFLSLPMFIVVGLLFSQKEKQQ